MSCTCDPCKKKFRISCTRTPEFTEGRCVYPDAFMVSFSISTNSICNCRFEREDLGSPDGGPFGHIRCCDRNAIVQNSLFGDFIVTRVTTNAEIINSGFTSSGVQNLNTYQYKSAGNYGYIMFQISPLQNRAFPCGYTARALFSVAPVTYPCGPINQSSGFDGSTFSKDFNYYSYSLPECDGSFTVSYGGLEALFGFPIITGVNDPCYNAPASATFTPIFPI